MNQCHVEGCKNEVSKPGHKLCYEHWQDERDGIIIPCKAYGKLKDNDYPLCRNCYSKDMADKSESLNKNAKEIGSSKTLTATAIGKELGLRNRKVNQILEELGWIRKEDAGFFPTRQGRENGGFHREHSQSGASYVVWDQTIIKNKIFLNSIREFRGEDIEPLATEDTKVEDKTAAFRNAFPATIRTKDGHMVRSRGEALIDNYLYSDDRSLNSPSISTKTRYTYTLVYGSYQTSTENLMAVTLNLEDTYSGDFYENLILADNLGTVRPDHQHLYPGIASLPRLNRGVQEDFVVYRSFADGVTESASPFLWCFGKIKTMRNISGGIYY